VPVTLGNFLVPLMLGARDLAFPRLNLLSWYLFVAAGLVVLYALFAGGVDTGWTFYTPLTSTYTNGHVVPTAVAIIIAGLSSIATGLNFIVTIHRLRAPGMTWYKMPVFLWSLYATSVILVLGTPVLATAAAGVRTRFPHRRVRSGAWRRSAFISAPVLVLLPSGRVRNDLAGLRRD
jgi:cytochrome c oxidase subunit 1